MAKFPKETGGGWYELSDGTKVQGEEEAQKQEDALKGDSGKKGSGAPKADDPKVANRVDEGTGLQSLAVDREVGAESEGILPEDEDDPRGNLPVAGLDVIGHAESGEPIIAGGVPTASGVPAGQEGVNDPNLGVSVSTATALAQHEANRDEWSHMDEDDPSYDGSPVDRLKRTGSQVPGDDESATSDVDDN